MGGKEQAFFALVSFLPVPDYVLDIFRYLRGQEAARGARAIRIGKKIPTGKSKLFPVGISLSIRTPQTGLCFIQ